MWEGGRATTGVPTPHHIHPRSYDTRARRVGVYRGDKGWRAEPCACPPGSIIIWERTGDHKGSDMYHLNGRTGDHKGSHPTTTTTPAPTIYERRRTHTFCVLQGMISNGSYMSSVKIVRAFFLLPVQVISATIPIHFSWGEIIL